MLITQIKPLPAVNGKGKKIDRLRQEIDGFNLGLAARQAQDPSYRETLRDEAYEAEVAAWAARRAHLEQQCALLVPSSTTLLASIPQMSASLTDLANFERDVYDLMVMERAQNGGSDQDLQLTQGVTVYAALTARRQQLEARRLELGLPESALPPLPLVTRPTSWYGRRRQSKVLKRHQEEVDALIRRGKVLARLPEKIQGWQCGANGLIYAVRHGRPDCIATYGPNLPENGQCLEGTTHGNIGLLSWQVSAEGWIVVRSHDGLSVCGTGRPDDIFQPYAQFSMGEEWVSWRVRSDRSVLIRNKETGEIRLCGTGLPAGGVRYPLRLPNYPWAWHLGHDDLVLVQTRDSRKILALDPNLPEESVLYARLPQKTDKWYPAPGGIAYECDEGPDGKKDIRFLPRL